MKNNNEYVDTYRGNLLMERRDVNIPGRGLDLTLTTAFNSDGYFWNYLDSPINQYKWGWSSEVEHNGAYKIADGWRFKLPSISSMEISEHVMGYGKRDVL
jgi:hypothetical protein